MSKIIIHAPNIHIGGGRTLLIALLSSLNKPAVVQIDKRLNPLPKLAKNIKVIRVEPNVISRFNAELRLRSLCSKKDTLLCFGNLPPLFRNLARVFIYLQNRFLVSPIFLHDMSFALKTKILIERFWLRYFIRDSIVIVQTTTMAQNAKHYLGRKVEILPFVPVWPKLSLNKKLLKYDYTYVASGEPHKNHKRLLEAWVYLANHGLRPSLRLTVSIKNHRSICLLIKKLTKKYKLKIFNCDCAPDKIFELYSQSKALIYPSLFESFGLPLLEATYLKKPIIASERDYVRDLINPIFTFDPNSSLSIARAVARHQGIKKPNNYPKNSTFFIKKLFEIK